MLRHKLETLIVIRPLSDTLRLVTISDYILKTFELFQHFINIIPYLTRKWFKMSSELTLDEFDGSNCVDRVVSFGGNAAVAGILSY